MSEIISANGIELTDDSIVSFEIEGDYNRQKQNQLTWNYMGSYFKPAIVVGLYSMEYMEDSYHAVMDVTGKVWHKRADELHVL